MNTAEVAVLIQSLQENQFSLGMSWYIRPGVVDHVQDGVTYVRLDGGSSDDPPNVAIPIGAQVGTNLRVYCLVTSPTSIFIIGSQPSIGSPVLRVRQTAAQAITDNLSTFLAFDTLELDVFNYVNIGTSPTSFLPPVPGWYLVSGRGVFAANVTSRRGFFINTNGTTGAPGTVCGASDQAPATGTWQGGGSGLVYMNGSTDFIGARVLQNSGGSLNTANTDGGSVFEMVYLGGPLQT